MRPRVLGGHDWCERQRRTIPIEAEPGGPSVQAIIRGRRIRRAWAELTRAQLAGEPAPLMRLLCERCRLPSTSTAQGIVDALVAMGVVEVTGRHAAPTARGERRRVAGALRLMQPYGWESYL